MLCSLFRQFPALIFFGGIDYYLGVSKITGTPKWMVKIMEHPKTLFKMDDLGGFPLFLETPI